jgi:hypothetical protein
MSNNLLNIQRFFEIDNKLKKEIYDLCPDDKYTDKESLIKYVDRLNESLNYIFSELRQITNDYFVNNRNVSERVNSCEKRIKESFYTCNIDIESLKVFYKNYISDMRSSFIDSVKANCKGYAFTTSIPIKDCKTVNELLHFFHSYILNNEHILQSVPLIKEKINKNGEPISIRGVNVDRFNKLYDNIPFDLDIGYTDMVCVDENKLLMMIRDRGHALSMEITLKDDKARVEYYIPKICSVNMVNELPGINKVNESSVGATGVYEIDVDSLSTGIIDFINKVPTDRDLVREKYSTQTM